MLTYILLALVIAVLVALVGSGRLEGLALTVARILIAVVILLFLFVLFGFIGFA